MSIFIHIASYCDPELLHTIRDCIAKASSPHSLRFGICFQYAEGDKSLDEWRSDSRFRIVDVPAKETKGCCWARSISQSLYNNEDYVLQLDGHHRFEPDWDVTLIEMLKQTGSAKPIITAYAGTYDAEQGILPCEPWKMMADRFGHDGTLLFKPVKMEGWQNLSSPLPARFLSGHFMFTLGRHCLEVPYDPNLYFHGEEPSLSARSYTHGYDLFHPHRLVIYHQYHRKGRPKHWDEFPAEYSKLDAVSKSRFRQLMGMEEVTHDLTGFGFGTERTLADYEKYVGVVFSSRSIHADARTAASLPTPDDERWTQRRKVFVSWKSSQVELPENTTHVSYFIDDKNGKGMWHEKATAATNFQINPVAEFYSIEEPAFLIVWPHTAKGPGPKKYSIPLHQENVYLA